MEKFDFNLQCDPLQDYMYEVLKFKHDLDLIDDNCIKTLGVFYILIYLTEKLTRRKYRHDTELCYFTFSIFSSPDPKGHASYCQHLASVVRRTS